MGVIGFYIIIYENIINSISFAIIKYVIYVLFLLIN